MSQKHSQEPDLKERAEYLCQRSEAAAMYLSGLADAFEQAGGSKSLVDHLRIHANELNQSPLYVRHGMPTEAQLAGRKGGAQ